MTLFVRRFCIFAFRLFCSLPFSAFSFSHQLFDLSLYNNLLHATYYIVLFPLFHCNWRSRHFHDRLRLSFLSLFQIFTFFTFLYLHLLSFPSVSRSDAFSFAVIIYTFCAALVCLTFVSRFCYVSRFRQQNYLIIFKRLSVPFVCLHYWSLRNFHCFVTPRRTVHKHCTGFYLASIDLLWLFISDRLL